MKTRCRSTKDAVRIGGWLERNATKHKEGWLITIQKFSMPITKGQNAKFHVLLHDYCMFSGDDPADLKEAFKQEYGPQKTIRLSEDVVTHIPKSSSEWSIEEASIMIERLLHHAAENGIVLE